MPPPTRQSAQPPSLRTEQAGGQRRPFQRLLPFPLGQEGVEPCCCPISLVVELVET